MSKSTPEGKVKKEISAYLKALGVFYRMPVSLGYGADQVDYYGCNAGRYFTIEAKRADKPAKPTTRQEKHLKQVREAGGLAIVATSAEDVKQAFFEDNLPF
jgi:hypothetical protein